MSKYTDLQEKVIAAAREQLWNEPWFRGVYCDDMPTDEDIEEDFAGAVCAVVMETCYWDEPNHGL